MSKSFGSYGTDLRVAQLDDEIQNAGTNGSKEILFRKISEFTDRVTYPKHSDKISKSDIEFSVIVGLKLINQAKHSNKLLDKQELILLDNFIKAIKLTDTDKVHIAEVEYIESQLGEINKSFSSFDNPKQSQMKRPKKQIGNGAILPVVHMSYMGKKSLSDLISPRASTSSQGINRRDLRLAQVIENLAGESADFKGASVYVAKVNDYEDKSAFYIYPRTNDHILIANMKTVVHFMSENNSKKKLKGRSDNEDERSAFEITLSRYQRTRDYALKLIELDQFEQDISILVGDALDGLVQPIERPELFSDNLRTQNYLTIRGLEKAERLLFFSKELKLNADNIVRFAREYSDFVQSKDFTQVSLALLDRYLKGDHVIWPDQIARVIEISKALNPRAATVLAAGLEYRKTVSAHDDYNTSLCRQVLSTNELLDIDPIVMSRFAGVSRVWSDMKALATTVLTGEQKKLGRTVS